MADLCTRNRPPRQGRAANLFTSRAPRLYCCHAERGPQHPRPRSARMASDITILPVYVSSTWLDLQPERKAVEQAVQRLRETKFVGMEYFGSRDEDTRTASLDDIDRSRAYVCVVAGRYGSGITE